jgi:hypothetical protein
LIEPADGGFGYRAIGIIHEGEAARPPCFTVDWENNLGGFTDTG